MSNNKQPIINHPSIERLQTAYRNADESPEIRTLLRDLYGDAVVPAEADNRPVTERIKTLDDACRILNESARGNHPYVREYIQITDAIDVSSDIIAYLKLRIIVAALNEGWEPQFVEDEHRWAPWFVLYTNEEIERMDDDSREKICRVVGRSNVNAGAYGGLKCATTYNAGEYVSSHNAARLVLKSEALAKYAETQFIEIYRDFIIAR